MPVFIGYYYILHNLLYVFIGSFYFTIHLRSVRGRIVMLDFELRAESSDHNIVEVSSVVSDNPFGDAIPAYEVMLDKLGYNILSD